jgi:hypothetical protein
MSQHSGYYSVVQFCPDPSRLESVNIGVVLYSSTEKRLQVQMSESNQRIRRCFGNQDWNLLDRARKAIARQLRSEHFMTVDELIAYIAKRANMIQLTHPRPMRITDIEADTIELHKRLVGPEPSEPKCRIAGYLTKRLFEAGVSDLVKKSVSVELPEIKKSIRVPYAYQNGRFNLISPVQFDADTEAIVTKIGKNAFEGQLLFNNRHPTFGEMRLVVVANFDSQIETSTREFVKKAFDQYNVTLYSFEDLSPLVEDIKRSAEIHSMDQLG